MNHREEMYRCVVCHGELSVMHHDIRCPQWPLWNFVVHDEYAH